MYSLSENKRKIITWKGNALFTHSNTATDWQRCFYPLGDFFLFYSIVVIIIIIVILIIVVIIIILIINNPLTAGQNIYLGFYKTKKEIVNIFYF